VTLEGIVIGLFAVLVGIAFCFAGYKYFLILLPIWGFLVGFTFGSNLIYHLTNDPNNGFFVSALAILIGLVTGIVFALLSYLYYYFAVILLGAGLGYMLGVGLMDLINLDGFLAFIVGIIVAAVFAFGFIVLAMPAVLAIWGTAIGGAIAIVGGAALALGRLPVSSLNSGGLGAALNDTEFPWFWIIAGIVLAVVGAFYQIRSIGTAVEAYTKESYRNPGMA
jgi:hypothetical protein